MAATTNAYPVDNTRQDSFYGETEKHEEEYVDRVADPSRIDRADMTYLGEDEEPELHLRTYIAISALFILNYVQLVALTGAPALVHSPSSRMGTA